MGHRAGAERHLQGGQWQVGLQMRRQAPADQVAAERIQQDCQIDELLGQPHIGQIGHHSWCIAVGSRCRGRLGYSGKRRSSTVIRR